jgi:subtilisin
MNISGPLAAAFAVTLTVAGATSAQAGESPLDSHVAMVGSGSQPASEAKDYVVMLNDDATVGTALAKAENAYGASVDNVYRSAIKGYSASMTPAEARALEQSPGVASVEPDIRFEIATQSMPTGINRTNADRSRRARVKGPARPVNVDVAVIDTGVDLDHRDLNVYRRGAKNCSMFARGVNDQHGHGTHVAGTIGARDNRFGVVGMAPGARIWPVRVFDRSGAGSLSEVICGVDYVTRHANQIEVANMSLSSAGGRDDGKCGTAVRDPLHKAICRSVARGVTYVVAAGNMSQNAALSTPASYNEVITVSAMADFNGRAGGGARSTCRPDVDDTFADFSNFGSDVDLIAPGVCIRSTWKGGGYSTLSGTSMAAPHVAGGAALYVARHPKASPAAVRAALVRAGSSAWNPSDDPDADHERLLNVAGF